MRFLVALALACTVAGSPAAAGMPVKVLQSWTGYMPAGVAPLFQASVANDGELQRVWVTCQVGGTPPKIDFDKRLVLLAVRNGSVVKFARLSLDNGNLVTNVAVSPDVPGRQTCALALVDRKGIKSVNGKPVGK